MAWANSSDNPSGLSTWLLILWSIAAPLLAIFAAASPALKIKPKVTLLLVGATLAIVLVLDPLSSLLWLQANQSIGLEALIQSFFLGFGDVYSTGRSLATVFGVLGAIAFAISFSVKSQPDPSPENVSFSSISQGTEGAGFATPNLPFSGQVVSSFPTLTLVFAFFSPILSIVLWHVTLNHMQRGLISSANISTAKAGLVVGYVLTALGLLALIL
ncbi:MAG: hypothetical protein NTX78_02360 [Rhodoluna sp.]|nr:hypothetical protein [Rhodoluna sp.]